MNVFGIDMQRRRFVMSALAWLFFSAAAAAQTPRTIPVTYVADSSVYLGGGAQDSLAVGDTLRVLRGDTLVATVVVVAVSEQSALSAPVEVFRPIVMGDRALAVMRPGGRASVTRAGVPAERTRSAYASPPAPSSENVVSGIVGVQYDGIIAADSRLSMNQPALLVRLSVANLAGSGLTLRMNDRSVYDLSNRYSQYDRTNGLTHRLYEFSLGRNVPGDAYGFGVGRLSLPSVAGFGLFDGAMTRASSGGFTVGVAGGADAQRQLVAGTADGSKAALFFGYRSGESVLERYEGTVAYVRQMVRGNIDREFLSLQNSAALGPQWYLFETSEFDLGNSAAGGKLAFSNTLLSLSYRPEEHWTVSVSYDATRPVYLQETMKSIADSLLDRSLFQGVRGNVTGRIADDLTATLLGGYDARGANGGTGYLVGGALRSNDLLSSGVNGTLRYTDNTGVFAHTGTFMFGLDRMVGDALSLDARYTYNRMNVPALHQVYTMNVGTLDAYYLFSRRYYGSLSAEGVLDQTIDSARLWLEFGVRF